MRPDLGAAVRRAARQSAEEVSKALSENGKAFDRTYIKDRKNTYAVNIPFIELDKKFNSKAHYIHRSDFLRAFAPLVGAVIMEKYEKDYKKYDQVHECFNGFPIRRNRSFLDFCEQEVIPSRDRLFSEIGTTFIQYSSGISGVRQQFEVPFERDDLYEETITSSKDKKALFNFAKGYMEVLHSYGPHAQYQEDDYINIADSVKALETACKALGRISQKLKDESDQEEQNKWSASSLIVQAKDNDEKIDGDNLSLWQKVQNFLNP